MAALPDDATPASAAQGAGTNPLLVIVPAAELPLWLKHQLLAAVRIEWWWVFQGDNTLWDYTRKATEPRYVVLTVGDVLLSFAELNRRVLRHANATYRVDGVSAVYTFPALRRRGYGRQVVEAATATLDAGDGDLALLFCQPALVPFYERAGWARLRCGCVAGAPVAPEPVVDEVPLARARTSHGHALQQQDGPPLYVGAYTW